MFHRIFVFSSLIVLSFLLGCQSKIVRRDPQSLKQKYDPDKVNLLRAVASQGVLVQVPDSVFRDIPSASMGDRCRTNLENKWAQNFFEVLDALATRSDALKKIHVLQIQKGDAPQVFVTRDLDGATILEVSYAKRELREKLNSMADVPCANYSSELLDKERVNTSFEWPSPGTLLTALEKEPLKSSVNRFDFDPNFLLWLAEHNALFRYNSDLGFEKNSNGVSLIPIFMARAGAALQDPITRNSLSMWFQEISHHSKMGSQINFFALKNDTRLGSGLLVESKGGKINRTLSGFNDPTSLFTSYKTENGVFKFAELSQLQICLDNFYKDYNSKLKLTVAYDVDPSSFLYPGHSCSAVED